MRRRGRVVAAPASYCDVTECRPAGLPTPGAPPPTTAPTNPGVPGAKKAGGKKGSIDFAAADRSNLVFTAGVCATEMNETGRLIEKHWGVPDRPSTSAAERRVHVQVPGMSVRGTGAPVQNKGSGPKEYTESRLEARKNKRLGLSSSIPIGIGRPQSSPRRPIHAW